MRVNENNEANVNDNNKRNREMTVVTYLVLILFLVMIGYIAKFLLGNTNELLSNNKNMRQNLLEKTITKGSILANDGKVLAKTETNGKGKESRVYPYDGLFAHVVGRTKNGKTGLERSESYTMLTTNVNPLYSMVNEIKGVKNPGNHVVTTLDVSLQKAASAGIGDRKGAVIVMEADTGKILAMVSKPTYNPNQIMADWNRLLKDKGEESALYNRVTQGLYPPGSTFKLVTALEFMREQENPEKFRYQCTGSIGTGPDKLHCYNRKVHGEVSLESAVALSCNTAFAKIGTGLDIKKWSNLCQSLYFGKKIPFELDQSVSRFELSESDSAAMIRQTAFGQGNTLVTPLQNILLTAAACNNGTVMKPYLVDHVEDSSGNIIKENKPQSLSEVITKKESKKLMQMMEATVSYGTASALKGRSYRAGGKTGSAEFKLKSSDSHAWFVGFAEKGKKKIAVSIIVEAAGTGSEYAVPVARDIFDAYFD